MRRRLVVLASMVAACAPSTQRSAPSAQPETMATAPSLLGSYSVTLSDADVVSVPEEHRPGTAGAYSIAFHEANHFVVMRNGAQVVQGPYRVSGNQVIFEPGESGSYACEAAATYTWRMSSGQVIFTPVGTDPCSGQLTVLTTHPWAKNP